jgi:protein-disulfide isomerase
MRLVALSIFVVCGLAHATDLPGVDTTGLDKTALSNLDMLLGEAPCPCDQTARTNTRQCVQAKSCPAATDLASFAASKLKAGMGMEEVREALIKKYMDDHVNFEFDLRGTPSKGAKKPKVVIVEFADFECPHCAAMRSVLSDVVKAFPKQVSLHFKQFPLQHHEYSMVAARASLAAHKQGRFWQMHDIIFQNQGSLEDDSFKNFAAELGLNLKQFESDMKSDEIGERIRDDLKEGSEGVRSTPTLFINGKYYHGEKTVDGITQHIRGVLKAPKK